MQLSIVSKYRTIGHNHYHINSIHSKMLIVRQNCLSSIIYEFMQFDFDVSIENSRHDTKLRRKYWYMQYFFCIIRYLTLATLLFILSHASSNVAIFLLSESKSQTVLKLDAFEITLYDSKLQNLLFFVKEIWIDNWALFKAL